MRKVFAAAALATFVMALSAPAFAKEVTVKGTIVDETCYMKDKANKTNDHGDMKDCATICAKKGAPLAILTDDGKMLEITGGLAADKNAKLIAHVGHTVEITGDATEKDGKMLIASDKLTMLKK